MSISDLDMDNINIMSNPFVKILQKFEDFNYAFNAVKSYPKNPVAVQYKKSNVRYCIGIINDCLLELK